MSHRKVPWLPVMCVSIGQRLIYKILSDPSSFELQSLNKKHSFNFFLFLLGFASRKREEENKRREAEQQKGRLSPDSSRPQAPPCLPNTQAEPPRQGRTPSKQPPTSDMAQGPEHRACRGSPGRESPSRAPQKEQHLSPDLQGTDPRKPNGRCIAFVI